MTALATDQEKENYLKKTMPFTQYGRYAIVRDIINGVRKNRETFSILDIGGRGNNLKRFMEDDNVQYLEPKLENDDNNFIIGDGRNIPLEDESFDWVVSVDVFEHIPPEDREKFLYENLRVSKLGVLLVAPFNLHGVHEAEIFVNKCFKVMSGGKDHIWLREHIENGLPEPELVEQYLERSDYIWKVYNNNQLNVWKYYMAMTIGLNEQIESTKLNKLVEDIQFYYNDRLYIGDNGSPSYRKAFLIEKNTEHFESMSYLPADHNHEDDYEEIIEKTIYLFKQVARDLIKTNNRIKKENIASTKQLKHDMELRLAAEARKIKRLESDINNIINSRWWRLKETLLSFRNKVWR